MSKAPRKGASPFLRAGALCSLLATFSILATSLQPWVVLAPALGATQSSVSIVDYAFQPHHVNITTGVTVVWTYDPTGSSHHTVTSEQNTNKTQSGTPLLNSGQLNPGQSYSFTFYRPGFYPYYCGFHPDVMKNAWVNVTGPPMAPPVGPAYVNVPLLILGLGVGLIVMFVVGVFFYRRRKSAKLPPSTSM